MNLLVDVEVECPYCGETWTVTVDTSQGDYATIEDCMVCCRPIQFAFTCEPGEVVTANASST